MPLELDKLIIYYFINFNLKYRNLKQHYESLIINLYYKYSANQCSFVSI